MKKLCISALLLCLAAIITQGQQTENSPEHIQLQVQKMVTMVEIAKINRQYLELSTQILHKKVAEKADATILAHSLTRTSVDMMVYESSYADAAKQSKYATGLMAQQSAKDPGAISNDVMDAVTKAVMSLKDMLNPPDPTEDMEKAVKVIRKALPKDKWPNLPSIRKTA